eukprot:TRINITY_DN7137_c0_g2_i1.p2 TRINITY_DN7137_c0_g2~~TRINITY_DN7137_c0_g2_i1.p2  ORF type:complete len:147 (+),score=2.99 TRINITY_DN7137_c0_g2_i1:122-562(+)
MGMFPSATHVYVRRARKTQNTEQTGREPCCTGRSGPVLVSHLSLFPGAEGPNKKPRAEHFVNTSQRVRVGFQRHAASGRRPHAPECIVLKGEERMRVRDGTTTQHNLAVKGGPVPWVLLEDVVIMEIFVQRVARHCYSITIRGWFS